MDVEHGKNPVGVIVARFQVPELHAGHLRLIDFVYHRHENILIVLGVKPGAPTAHDPLPFDVRRPMIGRDYPFPAIEWIKPLCDHPVSHDAWSLELDDLIESCYPDRDAILYGSRGSFISLYTGKFTTQKVPSFPSANGTSVREKITQIDSTAFRTGMIYAVTARHPITYPTVDIAVVDDQRKNILLVGRTRELGQLRFPGGFADPSDETYEASALRELGEEIPTITVHNLSYIGSSRIDDYRYRGSPDSIKTLFFLANFRSGVPKAGDDVDVVAWVLIDDIQKVLVKCHQPLAELLRKTLRKEKLLSDSR